MPLASFAIAQIVIAIQNKEWGNENTCDDAGSGDFGIEFGDAFGELGDRTNNLLYQKLTCEAKANSLWCDDWL